MLSRAPGGCLDWLVVDKNDISSTFLTSSNRLGPLQSYLDLLDEHASYSVTHPHLIVDTIRPVQECIVEIIAWSNGI